ncbi:MAG: hypothetical protein ACRELB_14315 [Polyangiaceae bacterium]
MVKVRAPALMARLMWAIERDGEAAHDATLAAMKPELAAVVRAAGDPKAWVPFEAFVALCEALDRRYGAGDLALCRELGRHAARFNLPTLYRLFYRLGSVPFILSKAAALWSEHYDSGRASTRDLGGGAIELVIEDFETPHRALCLSVLGWVEESVRLSGAKVLSAEEPACRTRGDGACKFVVRYE